MDLISAMFGGDKLSKDIEAIKEDADRYIDEHTWVLRNPYGSNHMLWQSVIQYFGNHPMGHHDYVGKFPLQQARERPGLFITNMHEVEPDTLIGILNKYGPLYEITIGRISPPHIKDRVVYTQTMKKPEIK